MNRTKEFFYELFQIARFCGLPVQEALLFARQQIKQY
jgi:hypothetical protein